jgi:glycosyltransferase involved in cell wall biosynthesis
MNKPELSIVILCYKAGESVLNFVEKTQITLNKAGITNYQLVLVGNYHPRSNDTTPVIISNLAKINPYILFVAKPKMGMMGWDMKSGFEIAQGDYISVIDGDGQMPVEDLVKVYKEIKEKKYDLVKTFRITRGDGIKRKVLSFFYNICFNILFPGINSHDINSKPKIFTRTAYSKLKLKSDDWFIDAEIMIQARRYKFKTGEIPTYFLGLRGSRKSFVNTTTIFEFIKNLIIYRLREFKY